MTESVIDPEAIERLEEWGGPDLVRKMIRLFLENAPERLGLIRTGLESGELEVAERGAHSLKSSSGNVGARELHLVCAEMEDLASEEKEEGMRNLLPRLEEVYERSISALSAFEQDGGE